MKAKKTVKPPTKHTHYGRRSPIAFWIENAIIVAFVVGFIAVALSVYVFADVPPIRTVAKISGIANVKDGDGILFGKVEIRLQGIAAPEYNSKKMEKFGWESSVHLRQLVGGKELICHLDGTVASSNRPGIR